MFIWIVHRISGAILIVLIVFKIITGYGIIEKFGKQHIEFYRALHKNKFSDVLLFLLFTYHAIYGLRTMLIDLGFRRERLLFWISNALGCVLFILLVLIFLL